MRGTEFDGSSSSGRAGRVIASLLGLLLVVVAVGYFFSSRKATPDRASDLTDKAASKSSSSAAGQAALTASAGPILAPSIRSPNGPPIRSPEDARMLLEKLFQMDVRSGSLSDEQIALVNNGFRDLSKLGLAGIPVIKEFLAKNIDLNFTGMKGAEKLNFGSLRTGLFDTLKQIGGEEAADATLQVLKTTADPSEVAILARNLDQISPGEFRSDTINAVREILAQSLDGKTPARDLAPLFQLLKSYGSPEVIADLQKSMSKWSYYSAITLGSLPDGQGIPALVQTVQNARGLDSPQANAAWQILAQLAPAESSAAGVLLAKAGANQIADGNWPAIGKALAGAQLDLGTRVADNPAAASSDPTALQYRTDKDGQSLVTVPSTPEALQDQRQQRLDLINKLMSATTQPAALQALQSARTSLQAPTAGVSH